jgi:integrase
MAKVKLTDRAVKALKADPERGRYEVLDSAISGFAVRVSDKGTRTFILKTRYPGSDQPTRRALGEYPAMTLGEARTRASEWRKLINQGTDPALVEEQKRQAKIKKLENTFGAVAEAFIAEKLPSERKGWEVERDIRNEFLRLWGTRPITDITDLHVLAVINAKKRTAPAHARNLLGYARRLFQWAIDQRIYGLKISPCQDLKPTKIIGKTKARTRILSDEELFALWRAAKRTPYPAGPVYQLLMLTALRLNEAADAHWTEFDRSTWTIPEHRMKGARAHVVPLTPDILRLLETLPRFKGGVCLFSTTFGEKPAWISDKIKKQIDARMLRTLRALARQRGDDPANVELAHWVNHDVRRTIRSRLSRLKISEEAREAVLAHARPGIKGVYDHHHYLEEKREALELWAAQLRSIVESAPSTNVVQLHSIARA